MRLYMLFTRTHMKLAQHRLSAYRVLRLTRAYPADRLPLPLFMAALSVTSRATLFRRLSELGDAGVEFEVDGEFVRAHCVPSWYVDFAAGV